MILRERVSNRCLLAVIVASFGWCGQVSAQLTAELIASRIASDGGGTAEDYRDYSVKLATLLSTYSPAALQRILGENSVLVPQTLNDALELQPINFAYGSAQLSPESYRELDKVAEFPNANPGARILIEGHVSETYGGAQSLSESRALSARLYLSQSGIDPSRIESVGRGGDSPLEGATPEQNRRIAITVLE
jgi:outer membrane protein OmpA-like peptidoglycan-associated protein